MPSSRLSSCHASHRRPQYPQAAVVPALHRCARQLSTAVASASCLESVVNDRESHASSFTTLRVTQAAFTTAATSRMHIHRRQHQECRFNLHIFFHNRHILLSHRCLMLQRRDMAHPRATSRCGGVMQSGGRVRIFRADCNA